ncbi:MAG TPA: hypothetical protein VK437_06545 [Steroidobacteraceae bacterium]|nr:hypothetical protein [Steroidobacteraceae bacterium]
MRSWLMTMAWFCIPGASALASAAAAPVLPASAAPISPPRDIPYPGEIRLEVDARDVAHRIVHVHERLNGVPPRPVLLYPKWIPGTHAPEGPIDRLAGITFSVDGRALPWVRDPVEVYAFRPQMPAGARTLDVHFDYLYPTSDKVGDARTSENTVMLEWHDLVLYPAGHYASQISVSASADLPVDWQQATALERESTDGARSTYRRVSLETLIDSPLYAGRYLKVFELDPATRVRLDVFADRPDLLEASPEVLTAHRALVTQAYRLFRSRHYEHYDFLLALSEAIPFSGLEHHQSSADSSTAEYFNDWAGTPYDRDLLPHEYTHSWNGKFRRPADLWTPSYEIPMQNSLLWVYEGQTQYWGLVLTARSGLWTTAQALEQWAELAAFYSSQAGRVWRSVEDTTNDEIINPRRPQSWRDWQRFEDYYEEGALIWLEADTLIRERSGGRHSLDDFAAAFFGVRDGSTTPLTYTFEDIVKALSTIEPYDWAAFLRERIQGVGPPAPLEGITRGGYRLVWSSEPNEQEKSREKVRKRTFLIYSAGLEIEEKDDPGTLTRVVWNSPAFKAGLTEGTRIVAVDGDPYSAERLKQALTLAAKVSAPIELIVRRDGRFRVLELDYHGGLRYPHLEKVSGAAKPGASLEDILMPRS